MFSNRTKQGILYLILLTLVVILAIDVARDRKDVESPKSNSPKIVEETKRDSTFLFNFDPNTATLKELRTLGLSREAAVSIIRYRKSGKIYKIKEDLFGVYNLTDSAYYALEPYIKIGEKYRPRPKITPTKPQVQEPPKWEIKKVVKEHVYLQPTKFLIDTVSERYLVAIGALTRRQAEVFVKWQKLSGMRDMKDLRECYVVSDSIASALEPYVILFPTREQKKLVNLNTADSTELRSVVGIGEKTVVTIMEYREKLGGFHSVEQLSEVKMVTESNFERIIKQISCDSCDISKIDINFALAKNLMEHPYVSRKALRRLLKTREIKGGWSSIAEMVEDDIFTREEANKLRPYLHFEAITKLQE